MGAAALAGYWVLNNPHGMDAETFLTLIACLAAMFDPIRKLSSVSPTLTAADAAAKRVFETLQLPVERVVPGAPSLARHCHSIELRHVTVRYAGAADDALRNVDLFVEAGQNVAIVGPNGSGKTTLVSLLPRLLDPTEGAVLIDGVDRYSCSTLTHTVRGQEITTIEGLQDSTGQLHPVQQAVVDEGGFQCAFCAPGFIMGMVALVEANPNPTREETAHALSGTLCRCGDYNKILTPARGAAEYARRRA